MTVKATITTHKISSTPSQPAPDQANIRQTNLPVSLIISNRNATNIIGLDGRVFEQPESVAASAPCTAAEIEKVSNGDQAQGARNAHAKESTSSWVIMAAGMETAYGEVVSFV